MGLRTKDFNIFGIHKKTRFLSVSVIFVFISFYYVLLWAKIIVYMNSYAESYMK